MTLKVDALVARIKWAAQHELAEYTGDIDGHRVTIIREDTHGLQAAADVHRSPASADSAPQSAAPDTTLTAPLAGLCHLKSENGTAPFIAVGDDVAAGQTLCIIEAMKVMTSVPAPRAGTIAEILVEDGATVDAGTPLVAFVE